jgi:hypothetical protein
MSIKYELYPLTGGVKAKEKKNRYYPRVVCHSTQTTDDIAQKLHHRSTYGKGELIGMIESLADVIQETLRNGECVHLKGIGFFQPTATCRKPIEEMNARNLKIEFKDVAYRPDAKIKKALMYAEFECSGSNSHFDVHSDDKWEQLLDEMLDEQKRITAKDLMIKTGCNKTTVWHRLHKWEEAGKIQNIGSRRYAIFERAEE